MNLNFTNHKHFKKTAFGLILVIIVALIGFNINTIKEGLTTVLQVSKTYTNSTEARRHLCKECTGAYIQNSGYNTCYWNKTSKLCGSFDDEGYSKKCDSDPTPTPNPSNDKCVLNTNCATCVKDGCFWSKMNSKCANYMVDHSYFKNCSDPDPNPDPSVCPYLPLGKDVYVKV